MNVRHLGFALLGVLAAGCGSGGGGGGDDDPQGVAGPEAPAGFRVQFQGRVVDQETRAPISGVFGVCGFGNRILAADGTFRFEVADVRESVLSWTATAFGFGTLAGRADVEAADQGIDVVDLGTLEMRRGRDLGV